MPSSEHFTSSYQQTLREHIEKDIAMGSRSEEDIDRSIERIKLYDTLKTFKITADWKSVSDIAAEILAV